MSANRKTPTRLAPHLQEFRQLNRKASQLRRAVDRFDRETDRQCQAVRRARQADRDAIAAPLKLIRETRQATYETEFDRLVNGEHVLSLTQADGTNPFTKTWVAYCSCDQSIWGKSPATAYKHHQSHVNRLVSDMLDALTPDE